MIYNRIALLRMEQNISRKRLARNVDVHYQTIGFIERGDYSPSLELAFKIARTLHVPISVVFSDKPFQPLFNNVKDIATNEATNE